MEGVRSGSVGSYLTVERALMGDGNSFPLVCAVVTSNFGGQSIVLCMCSGNVLLDIVVTDDRE